MTYRVELRRQDADGPMIVFPDQYGAFASVEAAAGAVATHARIYAIANNTPVLLRVYEDSGEVVMGTVVRPGRATPISA